MRIRIFAALFIIIINLLVCVPVYADTAQPTSVTVEDIAVNRHVIQSNDMVIYALYNIEYSVVPTDKVNSTFIFRLIDTDEITELGTNTAYAYRTSGYGYGVISFYFPAATAPAWGGAYTIRVSENPAVFSAPVDFNFPIDSGAYSAETTADANRREMGLNIFNLADILSNAWTLSLTSESDTGLVLSSSGEFYFGHAISGVRTMAPSIFLAQTKDPEYTDTTWDTSQADAYEDRFNETYVKTGIDGIASLFNTTYSMIGSIIILIACVLVIILAVKLQIKPSAGVVCAFAIFLVGVVLGWVPMAIMSVAVLICSIFLAAKLISQFV